MFICDVCGEVFSTPEYHKGNDICPGCGNKYYDEAARCTICHEYVNSDDAYGYGNDTVCKDCLKTRKDDISFLASAVEDTQDFELPMFYRYIFSDDDIHAILYRAALKKRANGELDTLSFIDDYANDIAEAMCKEES